jgi:hypothetical protein
MTERQRLRVSKDGEGRIILQGLDNPAVKSFSEL